MIKSFSGPNRFLSNFFLAPVEFEGEVYASTEHAYQASKTLSPGLRVLIGECPTPGEAKKLGGKVPVRSDWGAVKLKVMATVVLCKFRWHDVLRNRLLLTGEEELVEENPAHDNFWGNCTCLDCHDITGRNWLGGILMAVREELSP